MRICALKIETTSKDPKNGDIVVVSVSIYENDKKIEEYNLPDYKTFKKSLLNNKMLYKDFINTYSQNKYTDFTLYFENENEKSVQYLKDKYNHLVNNKEVLKDRLVEKEKLKERIPKLIEFLNNGEFDYVFCVNPIFTFKFLEKYCDSKANIQLKAPIIDLQTLYKEVESFNKLGTFKRDDIVKDILQIDEKLIPKDFESKTQEKTFNDIYFIFKLIKEHDLKTFIYKNRVYNNVNHLKQGDMLILGQNFRIINERLNAEYKFIEKLYFKEQMKQNKPIEISDENLEDLVSKIEKVLTKKGQSL